jgi:hypothetical protein
MKESWTKIGSLIDHYAIPQGMTLTYTVCSDYFLSIINSPPEA